MITKILIKLFKNTYMKHLDNAFNLSRQRTIPYLLPNPSCSFILCLRWVWLNRQDFALYKYLFASPFFSLYQKQ